MLLVLSVLLLASGCAIKYGRPFLSPDAGMIAIDRTEKTTLRKMFGEPYQMGIDSGDETWRWVYAEYGVGGGTNKDFTVRFNPNGTVKSYSFMSNFPADMSPAKSNR
jgi:hypothetical protein